MSNAQEIKNSSMNVKTSIKKFFTMSLLMDGMDVNTSSIFCMVIAFKIGINPNVIEMNIEETSYKYFLDV